MREEQPVADATASTTQRPLMNVLRFLVEAVLGVAVASAAVILFWMGEFLFSQRPIAPGLESGLPVFGAVLVVFVGWRVWRRVRPAGRA